MIFVTGATGFLGSHLLHDLVLGDKPVRALYRDKSKHGFVKKIFQYYHDDVEGLLNKIEWVQGDLMDYQGLTENLKGVDQVYHCAGLISFHVSDIPAMREINVEGTANLVNACLELNISRLCHVSSISALGISQEGALIDENLLWNQGSAASAYSVSKFRGEMEVWRGVYEGLRAVIVNPAVIIGPGMWHGSASGLFQQIDKGLKYYPPGATGYVDVRDVVKSMIRLTNSEISGERFIISAENKTHREILRQIAEGINRPVPDRPLTPWLSMFICNLEKLRSLITGKPVRITRTSVQIAEVIYSYTNQKITETLSFVFLPLHESIDFSSRCFKNEFRSGYSN
jgi:nucleoside-diphosphate-sugar epimerase